MEAYMHMQQPGGVTQIHYCPPPSDTATAALHSAVGVATVGRLACREDGGYGEYEERRGPTLLASREGERSWIPEPTREGCQLNYA